MTRPCSGLFHVAPLQNTRSCLCFWLLLWLHFPRSSQRVLWDNQSKCSVFLGHTTGLPTAPLLHEGSSVTILTKPLHSRPGHRKALLCPLHPLLAHTLKHALIPRSLQNSQSTTNSGAPWEEEMGLFLTESQLSESSIITPGMNSLRHSPETTHCFFRTSFSLSPKNLQVHFEQHFSLACLPLFATRLIPCISQHW